MSDRVAVYTHPVCLEHDPGPQHPEGPERLRAILRALEGGTIAGRVEWREAPLAPPAALERVHPSAHLSRLEAVADRGGGVLDADTVMSGGSWMAARYAAGAAVAAAHSALDGVPAFAAVRPPGHHATATRAMGFCLLNNVVVAARSALADRRLRRVLIIDWDVHHGNGTQELIERDPSIRYVSLHQWPLYPGTGRAEDHGVGNVFNVPRPPGRPREEYRRDLSGAVDRAVDGWTPELILISAGFDALRGDPLAGFTLEPPDYASWLTRWKAFGVPIASVLEGGYVPARIAAAAVAHLEAL